MACAYVSRVKGSSSSTPITCNSLTLQSTLHSSYSQHLGIQQASLMGCKRAQACGAPHGFHCCIVEVIH